MLSKIKSAGPTIPQRPIADSKQLSDADVDEEEEDEDEVSEELILDTESAPSTSPTVMLGAQSSDSNNNNNENDNKNSKNDDNDDEDNEEHQAKKNEDELLDIVEVSRKRRLSKDSADSLTSFIKWSFTNSANNSVVPPQDSVQSLNLTVSSSASSAAVAPTDAELDDEALSEDDWSSASNLKRRFRESDSMRNGLESGGSSFSKPSVGLNLSSNNNNASSPKRQKILHSPETVRNNNNNIPIKKSVGNVVDRLHQMNQLHHQPQVNREQQLNNQNDSAPTTGLSFHLQQFLQQQTSLEDLCSTVGLADNNNQLVLAAAAIHRALMDSNQGVNSNSSNPLETKSTASSIGSSSSSTGQQPHHQFSDQLNRQRRAYNTRAALSHSSLGLNGVSSAIRQQQQQQAMNMTNNRLEQQRHAQAAAALSALAASANNSQQQHLQHQLAATALAGLTQHHHHHHQANSVPLAALSQQHHHHHQQPIVEFKCDTCPSSFDDRHRLMQHQSIHLELKKDWFTETPVDEVMKIFNRRRGEFLCNLCNLRFEATLDYDQHNHQIHGPRPYCCQFCGNGTRTFKCWRQYLNHLYDHRYIFSCTIDDCDFTVNRRDSLRFHIFRFHLNCQLPQNMPNGGGGGASVLFNQQSALQRVQNLMLSNGNGLESKWPDMNHEADRDRDEDDDDDTENEMNVAD